MRHLLPLLIVIPLVVVAAPVPKESSKDRMKRLFGEITDPKKGYDYSLDGDELVLTTAAGASIGFKDTVFPRVEKEVTGDFDARVTATLSVRVGNVKGSRGEVVVGLCVWTADGRHHWFGHGMAWDGGWKAEGLLGDFLPDEAEKFRFGRIDYDEDEILPKRHFRLQGDKDGLKWSTSPDGKKWNVAVSSVLTPPETVRVGMCGLNWTDAEWTATFSDLVVTPVKAEK